MDQSEIEREDIPDHIARSIPSIIEGFRKLKLQCLTDSSKTLKCFKNLQRTDINIEEQYKITKRFTTSPYPQCPMPLPVEMRGESATRDAFLTDVLVYLTLGALKSVVPAYGLYALLPRFHELLSLKAEANPGYVEKIYNICEQCLLNYQECPLQIHNELLFNTEHPEIRKYVIFATMFEHLGVSRKKEIKK